MQFLRLITILLTLISMLFASGGVAWGNVVIAHCTVSRAPGRAAATFSYDMRSALTSISSNDFIQTLYRGEGTFPSKSGRITKNDIRLTGRNLTSNYQYDQAGRLIKAASALENTGVDYTEEFDYDLNTNIIGLRRYGGKNATTGALIDDLTMTYEGNQLRYVTDDATDYPYEASLDFRAKAPIEDTPGASVAGPFDLIGDKLQPIDSTKISPSITPGGSLKPLFSYSADYAYDANGNMTQDRHSSITSIAYNVLNLPQTVTYEGIPINRPVSQIVYDASGKKHIVRNGSMVGTRFNGDETRYIGQYIMVNDTIDRLQTPYGYLRDGVFHAYVFDYQGNVMAVVAGNNVVQTNLYYPDGLPMNTSTGITANAFKYTAKELSLFRGLPVYDYTARHTLPAGGNMFRTMDPFAEKYHGISPYTFCAGDPINFTDPTGMDIYMLFYTTGNQKGGDEIFKSAAETRKTDIENSNGFDSSKDIVIITPIEDLAELSDKVDNIISLYSDTYGSTKEFGIWSHSALDGPSDSQPTTKDLAHPQGKYQMSLKGWSDINFNWSENASASFYGCRSGVINTSDGTNCSFSTKISGLQNFHNVDVYGQSSYSYPSREATKLSRDLDIYLGVPNPPVYMVGREANNFFGSSILKMRKSRNGKGSNVY